MSVEMNVNIEGLPELENKLELLDQSMRIQVEEALDFQLEAMRTRAYQLAPKRTGYLASTIFVERVREWAFKFGARAPYAVFVEFGTRLMQPRRFLSQALQFCMPGLVQDVNRAIDEAIREAST